MLIKPRIHQGVRPQRQSGVVLIVALVVLVAMTLAGLSMTRSMDTSNIVAGNMAFQQATTQSADLGVQTAIGWLQSNRALLNDNVSNLGYTASTGNNSNYASGAAFWAALSPAGVCNLPLAGGVCTGPATDSNGFQIAYMIQRLCSSSGTVISSNCSSATSPTTSASGASNYALADGQMASADGLEIPTVLSTSGGSLTPYRITVRVIGPRNAVSYVQAYVSL